MNERNDRKLLDINTCSVNVVRTSASKYRCRCANVGLLQRRSVNEIMSLSASTNSMTDAGLCCIISCAFVHVHVTMTKTNRRNHFGF